MELSPEELAAIIEKTGGALEDMKMEEAEEGGADDDDDDYETEEEVEDAETENKSGKVNDAAPGEQSKEDDDFNKKFDMDNYDDDGSNYIVFYCNVYLGTCLLFSNFAMFYITNIL